MHNGSTRPALNTRSAGIKSPRVGRKLVGLVCHVSRRRSPWHRRRRSMHPVLCTRLGHRSSLHSGTDVRRMCMVDVYAKHDTCVRINRVRNHLVTAHESHPSLRSRENVSRRPRRRDRTQGREPPEGSGAKVERTCPLDHNARCVYSKMRVGPHCRALTRRPGQCTVSSRHTRGARAR